MKKYFHIFCSAALLIACLTSFAQNAIGFGSQTTKNSLKGSGMMFTPNKGQIADTKGNFRPDILYKGDGGGAEIYLRKTGVSYVTSNMGEVMHEINKEVELRKFDQNFSQQQTEELKRKLEAKALIKIQRTDVDFEGSNPNPQTLNQEEVEGYTNYYYAHCPNGITNVKSYNRVVQKNIYKGIDVIYYGGKEKGLKYDIVVNPGADPNQIKLNYTGAKVKLNGSKLIVQSELGETVETLPKVYQNINGKIVDVGCEYKLVKSEERIANREKTSPPNPYSLLAIGSIVTFELKTYNHELPLIIDPWVTYYGGSGTSAIGEDRCTGTTTDPGGDPVFVGWTRSVGFPTTVGAWQVAYGGIPTIDPFNQPVEKNAWAVKFTPSGNRVWATFYGGYSEETKDVTCDQAGNIILVGDALNLFPVGAAPGYVVHKVAFADTAALQGDVFILKLNSAGMRLFASYYGGNAKDFATSITTDGTNLFLYGYTYSPTDIATAGALSPSRQGVRDVFLVKFLPNGTRSWGTYFGGGNVEEYGDCAYDPLSNSVYIVGNTGNNSAGFPILALPGNFIHRATRPWPACGFIAKLSVASTPSIIWSTYYLPNIWTVTVDMAGNCIIGGDTQDNSGVGIAGPVQQPTWGGSFTDGFVSKFNSVGQRLWGTYVGGNTLETVYNVITDNNNNIFVQGEFEDAGAGNYKISSCAYQNTYGGGPEDLFIAKYTPAGKQVCVTYLGGTGEDDVENGRTFAIYNNFLYIAGYANAGLPVTSGAFQPTFAGGNYDAFFAQLCVNLCEQKVLGLAYNASSTSVCVSAPIKFTPSVNNACDTTGYKFQWVFTGGTPAFSDSVSPTVKFSGAGNFDVKLVVTTLCKKDSITKTNYITVTNCGCTLNAQYTKGTANCSNCGCKEWIMVTAGGGTSPYTYTWPDGYTNRYKNGLCPGTYTVNVKDKNGCSVNINLTTP